MTQPVDGAVIEHVQLVLHVVVEQSPSCLTNIGDLAITASVSLWMVAVASLVLVVANTFGSCLCDSMVLLLCGFQTAVYALPLHSMLPIVYMESVGVEAEQKNANLSCRIYNVWLGGLSTNRQ